MTCNTRQTGAKQWHPPAIDFHCKIMYIAILDAVVWNYIVYYAIPYLVFLRYTDTYRLAGSQEETNFWRPSGYLTLWTHLGYKVEPCQPAFI